MQNLVILGASGSIGQSTLKVLRHNPGAGRCWR
jgi:1-deoxy-D-xylulose-5-phosphate reductoisomerase